VLGWVRLNLVRLGDFVSRRVCLAGKVNLDLDLFFYCV